MVRDLEYSLYRLLRFPCNNQAECLGDLVTRGISGCGRSSRIAGAGSHRKVRCDELQCRSVNKRSGRSVHLRSALIVLSSVRNNGLNLLIRRSRRFQQQIVRRLQRGSSATRAHHQAGQFSAALPLGRGSPGCRSLGPQLAPSLRASGQSSRSAHRQGGDGPQAGRQPLLDVA